ncbi:MAG: arsenate reductase ArsC [Rhizobiales bacterium]|nr:arsenate reductase ArsC [Hyphomicrobiales bacterium]
MTDRIFNVLFLCTGNSARSIMAEAILNRNGQGRFRAFSAGSRPKPSVNPLTFQVLESFGYPTEGLRSKSWREFAGLDAPHMDFVFSVCDVVAGEICPLWPGQPLTAHWRIEDPAVVTGSLIDRTAAFVLAARYLRNRIALLTALPTAKLDDVALGPRLVEIELVRGLVWPRKYRVSTNSNGPAIRCAADEAAQSDLRSITSMFGARSRLIPAVT